MLKVYKIFFIALMLYTCISCASVEPKRYSAQIVKSYPHSKNSYTQGLFFHNDTLYESTGIKGESRFMKLDFEKAAPKNTIKFADKYFVEGSVILNGKIFILTWLNKVAFVYDAKTLQYIKTYSYPRAGWGLTTDGTYLIASDGSANIYFMSENFEPVRQITVKKDGKLVTDINELEYIDGKIWANVYTTDLILIINPDTGNVDAIVDCSTISSRHSVDAHADVLNGIAYNPLTKKVYITGKYWDKLYEIKLEQLK